MKTILKYRTSIIIGILLLIIIFQRACRPEPCKEPQYRDTTIYSTTTDTFTVQGPVVYLPKPYAVHDTVTNTIYKTHADTVKAIKDYQLTRSYVLPIVNDTNGCMEAYVNVQHNRILSWYPSGELYSKRTIIDHNHYVIEEKRNKVFLGLQAGYLIPENDVILAPTVALLTKKDVLTQVSYDPLNKAAQIAIYWKLKFKQP